MIFSANDTLLMIGDSVTDVGRARPTGEGRGDGWGTGYAAMVGASLQSMYPELNLRVVNMGISGNTVRDLNARWHTDVLGLAPNWVSIMIGINDVWRQYDTPLQPQIHVCLPEYRATLEELVSRTLPHAKGVILMTPYFMEPNRTDAMRATMDTYGAAVREVAEKYSTIFVDTQAMWDAHFAHMHPCAVAWDRVHPNPVGHMLLARTFLKAIGFDR